MNIKKILPIILVLVIIGGGAFYGGMKYQQSKSPLARFSAEQRQQAFQGNMEEDFQGRDRVGARAMGTGFLSGEVVAKDEQSLTLKMLNGGSRIIFFSDSIEVSKTTDGSMGDVEIGKQIMVTGDQNSDGSYTAETIQLLPRSLD